MVERKCTPMWIKENKFQENSHTSPAPPLPSSSSFSPSPRPASLPFFLLPSLPSSFSF